MPDVPPDHTPLGARLRERTQPLAPDDAANGYGHAYLCEGIGVMLDQVAEVYDPDGDVPPLAPILVADLCPTWALPWLAQFVGVVLPPGADDATARTMIKDVAGFRRGTLASITAAAGLYLTGTKRVYFNERLGGDAYAFGVFTLAAETPDPAAVEQAILAQKPGGITLSYSSVAGQTYRTVLTEVDSYREADAVWATYNDMLSHIPNA